MNKILLFFILLICVPVGMYILGNVVYFIMNKVNPKLVEQKTKEYREKKKSKPL